MTATTKDERAVEAARALDWRDPIFRETAEHETYRLLYGIAPVQSERNGEWHFVRYDDCRDAFLDPELFSNDWNYGKNTPEADVIPENTDGAAHREYRRLLDPMFHPRLMDELVADMHTFAADLVEKMAAKKTCDFVAEFSMPFPTITFCRLMGFPLDDHAQLMRWKDIYMNGMTPFIADRLGITDRDEVGRPTPEALMEVIGGASAQISAYLIDLIAQRRAAPLDDLITRLVQARRPDGAPFTDTELMQICFNLFLGGLDTVTSMISFIVADFAEHPERRRAFVALMHDEHRLAAAVEELVRCHSIVSIPRRVTRDAEFHGVSLREGDVVQLMTTGADRDPAQFDNPDSPDFDRETNRHLGFGLGLHRCLGIHLARREIRIALLELHRLMPEYSLDPANPAKVGSGGVRGLFTLPLIVG